jgi:hypothetical protein
MTPRSRSSPGSSPTLALEVRPSHRARLVWAGFCLVTGATLFLASGSPLSWRMVAGAVAGLALWVAGRSLLWGTGRRAVRSIQWLADGTWLLTGPDGAAEPACLSGATVTPGGWLFLAWKSRRAGRLPNWVPQGGRHALIDVREVGQTLFRTLKGRLSLQSTGLHPGRFHANR